MNRAEALDVIREQLLARGLTEQDLAEMDLASGSDDRLVSMAHALSIPSDERAGAATTLLLEACADDAQHAMVTFVGLAQPAAESDIGTKAMGLIAIACALAAASVLPEGDERTPGDFLRLLAEHADRHPEQFEKVRDAYQAVKASRDILADIARLESDEPFGPDDILG